MASATQIQTNQRRSRRSRPEIFPAEAKEIIAGALNDRITGSVAWKSIDPPSKSCLHETHANKKDWINSGVLLFGRTRLFRSRSTNGNVEAERSKIEDQTRDEKEHHGCL